LAGGKPINIRDDWRTEMGTALFLGLAIFTVLSGIFVLYNLRSRASLLIRMIVTILALAISLTIYDVSVQYLNEIGMHDTFQGVSIFLSEYAIGFIVTAITGCLAGVALSCGIQLIRENSSRKQVIFGEALRVLAYLLILATVLLTIFEAVMVGTG
jgi:hypothetical protein